MSDEGLAKARAAMTERGTSAAAIAVFERFYRLLESGAQGLIPEDTIDPLSEVTSLADVQVSEEERRAALAQVAVVKLNGGLGTSMGLSGPKTALRVADELTFLDIIARQTRALRRRYAVDLPLILMDSFRSSEESLAILASNPDLAVDGLPLDCLQNA